MFRKKFKDQYKWRDFKEKVVVLQPLTHSLHLGKIKKKKEGPCITARLLSTLFWFCAINAIINDRPPRPPVHFLLGEHFSSEVCARGWLRCTLANERTAETLEPGTGFLQANTWLDAEARQFKPNSLFLQMWLIFFGWMKLFNKLESFTSFVKQWNSSSSIDFSFHLFLFIMHTQTNTFWPSASLTAVYFFLANHHLQSLFPSHSLPRTHL